MMSERKPSAPASLDERTPAEIVEIIRSGQPDHDPARIAELMSRPDVAAAYAESTGDAKP